MLLIRKIFEDLLGNLAKNIELKKGFEPNWWEFTIKKLTSGGVFKYTNFDYFDSKTNKFIVKNFIRFLMDIKDKYNLKDIKEYIGRISGNDIKRKKKEDYLGELEKQNELGDYYLNHNDELNISSIISHNLYSIWETTSAFGAHSSNGYKPTLDTVNSLIYQLKEIIIWFGQVMEKIENH